ncbi:Metallo-dependent phosphatase-like protein [Syncephalastrum racemosum]|uniref:Sphingomyelin phosphodiesterase n=1 Tax=Syncephalastrum racemosum TaxID=13706 RepID=A0A1X2HP77_SYNRA|nr:Metallo-dependent phosphatase-like protein [Syncephalastrum racemosum]
MRILSLFVLATSVLALAKEYQTPFSAQHLAEEELLSATEQWLHTDSIQKSCSSCISLMQIVKNLSFMSETFLIATLTNVCQRTQKVDKEVCAGVIREQAPILRKVLKTMEVSGRDGHLLCAAVLNSCPYPEVEPWQVPFPKPKPSHVPERRSSGRTFSVLQLSDWHVDPLYEAGSEALCDKPICCRADYTDFSNITRPASIWGAYSCDTPISLIESLLEFIPTVAPEISFGILTGDVPPHEVWSTLPTIKTQLIQDESYRLLHSHFDSPELINTLLYPAVGNHESAPTNIFPLKTSKIPIEEKRHYLFLEWLYKSLSLSWRGWLTRDMTSDVERNSGSYVARPVNGLKLISVNTNFCYNMNWWLYEHPTQKDPNGVLGWLVDQLQESEDRGERVWIMGHIAPGDSTCFHDYSNYYHQIVERYAHVIAGQFFGHTHKDEFQMFYKDGSDRRAEDAISMAYVSPSITPFLNVNPGFRLYQVDADTFEVIDSMTYVADLDQADTWITGPNWHLEYSAREAYNSTVAPLSGYTSPLTPAWWHNVTVAMEEDHAVFEKYWKYRFKSAPVAPGCDEECRNRTVCAVRAGRSEERCDFESDVFPGQNVQPTYTPEEHACSGLFLGSHQV